MNDKFEIDVHYDGITVWAINWKGGAGVVAEFDDGMTKRQIAQELYELLASGGNEVRFKEEA